MGEKKKKKKKKKSRQFVNLPGSIEEGVGKECDNPPLYAAVGGLDWDINFIYIYNKSSLQ